MAIIEELGLGATVLINNEPAPEYPDTEPSVSESLGPDTKKSHCYVECVEGAEFAVRFEVKAPRNDIKQWLTGKDNGILFWVDIDGGRVEARPNVVCGETSHTLTGVKDRAKGLLHKFRFTSFSTVDDSSKDRVARDTEMTKNLGEIRLRAWRVIRTNTREPTPFTQQSPIEGQIAEKALKGKAISLGTTFAHAVEVARKKVRGFEWVDVRASPLAVFYFQYRSKEDLQRVMIIPRTRSPSPVAEDDEVDDFAKLSKKEIERLARERHAELRGRKRSASIKREDDVYIPRAARPYKYTRITGGIKAIDLTEDDDDE